MSLATDPLLAPLPVDRPVVAREARLPAGFVAAGTTAGIKASGRPDFALVVAAGDPVPAAAVFTPNRLAAAPVRLSAANLRATGGTDATCGYARAVISTSGSANAATGAAGDDDQAAIGAAVATALDCRPSQVLHLSTGIIGTRLPLDLVTAAIDRVAGNGLGDDDAGLRDDDAGLAAAAEALRTTDSVTKAASVTVEAPGRDGGTVPITVTGIAKGVGMIHPRMATMLSIVLTDATAAPRTLHALLRRAAATTWDQLSVDGDTSTNDTVFLLASGRAGAADADTDPDARAALAAAVEAVARDLARQQARDGEGATALLTCQVTGAVDDADARAVARAVISSSLVKAAVHGKDANWGRIAGAAGNALVAEAAILEAAGLGAAEARARAGQPAQVDPARLRIAIAGHLAYDGPSGGPQPIDKGAARASMDAEEVLIRLDLGLGDGTGEAFGCPLTEDYVRENSEYTT